MCLRRFSLPPTKSSIEVELTLTCSRDAPIAGLPPGSYTVEAWHERYGAKTAEIAVAADKPAQAAFAFEAK